MIFIWYNPDNEQYEKGSMLDYDRKILNSANQDRYGLLYEFNSTSQHLVDKVLTALNQVRIYHRESIALHSA
jgi:hypothetical protein